jgi:4,5-dihydroxyphthalate decarboxylase
MKALLYSRDFTRAGPAAVRHDRNIIPRDGIIMHKLKLTLACGRYDRTQPLIDGRVEPQGVELTFLPMRPGETFWRMLNHGEFDVSEMSLSSYTILRSEGDTRFIAIPVFPSRVFRHSAIYLPAGSRLERPEELAGKRIGVGDYQMTAAVWTRGMLMHEYGVRPEDVIWVTGKPIRSIAPPAGIRMEAIPADTTLEAMLERGEIDALMSVMIPKSLGKTTRRLFREPRKVESDYYRKTGIFPIMHTLVLKTALYQQHPWLAASFYRAFCRARDLAYAQMYDTDALTVSLPWVIDDVETTRDIFGPQIWDYSIEGSRPTLEALMTYLDEQKLSRRRMTVEELFVPNISPELIDYLRATGED